MTDDRALRAKLSKVEELFRRAGSPGERAAAEAAMDRLNSRLGGSKKRAEPEVELQYSLPDSWSVRLFIAVCRKHGVHTFRYRRQRHTTVMVRTQQRVFDREVWPEFVRLQSELADYFVDVTDHLVERVMRSDGDDSNLDMR